MARFRDWPVCCLAGAIGFCAVLPSASAVAADEEKGLCAQVVEEVEANPELQSQLDELVAQGADAGAVTQALLQAGFPISAVVSQVMIAFGAEDQDTVRSVINAAIFETQQFGVHFVRTGAACAGADMVAANQAIRIGLANLSGISQTDGLQASPN